MVVLVTATGAAASQHQSAHEILYSLRIYVFSRTKKNPSNASTCGSPAIT